MIEIGMAGLFAPMPHQIRSYTAESAWVSIQSLIGPTGRHADEEGVLILSSFAGASRELFEALIVNPYDGQQTAKAIGHALEMPVSEQRERMRFMRQQVREENVYRWAGRMLVDAAQPRQRQRIMEMARVTA